MSQAFDFGPPVQEHEQAFDFGPPEETISTAEAAARGGLQGVTANWADEAAGAIDVAKAAFRGDYSKSPRQVYEEGRNESRAKNKAAQRQHPTAYGAGELGGGLALGAAAAPLGAAGFAAQGAAAASGASEDENPVALAKEAAQGAVLGALAGKAAEKIGGLVGKGVQGAGKMAASAGDRLAAQTLGGRYAGKMMALADRPGSLVERAGRLGLMDSVSLADREAAAAAAKEMSSGGYEKIFGKLDTMAPPPQASTFVAGLTTAPQMASVLNHPAYARGLSAEAQKMIQPIIAAPTWAEKWAALEAMRPAGEAAEANLAKGSKNILDLLQAKTYGASRGILLKAADDAAVKAGQPVVAAQVADLQKDFALAGLAHKGAQAKQASAEAFGTVSKLIRRGGALGLALHGNIPAAAATLVAPAIAKRATPLAAKAGAALGGALSKETSGLAKQVARGAPGVAAQFMGRKGAKQDDLSVAGAHMIAQQTSASYRKKAGDKENER